MVAVCLLKRSAKPDCTAYGTIVSCLFYEETMNLYNLLIKRKEICDTYDSQIAYMCDELRRYETEVRRVYRFKLSKSRILVLSLNLLYTLAESLHIMNHYKAAIFSFLMDERYEKNYDYWQLFDSLHPGIKSIVKKIKDDYIALNEPDIVNYFKDAGIWRILEEEDYEILADIQVQDVDKVLGTLDTERDNCVLRSEEILEAIDKLLNHIGTMLSDLRFYSIESDDTHCKNLNTLVCSYMLSVDCEKFKRAYKKHIHNEYSPATEESLKNEYRKVHGKIMTNTIGYLYSENEMGNSKLCTRDDFVSSMKDAKINDVAVYIDYLQQLAKMECLKDYQLYFEKHGYNVDEVFASWVDIERLKERLRPYIEKYIKTQEAWVALLYVMLKLKILRTENKTLLCERMNKEFPYAAKPCREESIRKDFNRLKDTEIQKLTKAEKHYDNITTFNDVLNDKKAFSIKIAE